MTAKAALKAAKAAIDQQDWPQAIEQSKTVLSTDPQNYFAKLFLGRAYEKQGNLDRATETYHSAATNKPDDIQAWLGLISVSENRAGKQLDVYREAGVNAARIAASEGDVHRAHVITDKLVDYTKRHGTDAQRKAVLQELLPDGVLYQHLEGRIQHPSITYTRIAQITEEEEARIISKEVAERRTRLGARLGQVTLEVKREVYGKSDLTQLYQHVIDWTNDDEVRRQYEEKLLERSTSILDVTPMEEKSAKLDQVLNLAEGMVIIGHPYQLAWDLVLETRDIDDLRALDVNVLRSYITFFPESGLAKILTAWLQSDLSPFPQPTKEEAEKQDHKEASTPEDRLIMMSEGLSDCETSLFGHRLVSDYYLHLEEYQIASETSRAGLKSLSRRSTTLGLTLQNTKDALNLTLGTTLVHLESPRNHPEAKRLFTDILERKPKSTPALIGLGLIFEETEDYPEAIDFLSKALGEDPSNVRVGTELSWCRALSHDHSVAIQELEHWLGSLESNDPRTRDLRAQTLYRIGYCMWQADTSRSARKDRAGAYSRFIAAIKTNVNFAPAYTSLGIYYSDYAKDKKRARQCFQKAFELSPAEVDAAERLAKSFADKGDWDIVEVVAKRVVDSGRTRPPPGSKKKGLSWPYSALGIVQMNRQDYQQAIVSFLAALRITPDDYESYVGLGESYQNSGRYNSALRTFHHALELRKSESQKSKGESWFAEYMLANVHHELGDFDEAIEGLNNVLQERPSEFGVLISLIQTHVDRARYAIETGQFGLAIQSAKEALNTAEKIAPGHPDAFNLWKAVGDACSIFLSVQSSCGSFPSDQIDALLNLKAQPDMYEPLADMDTLSLAGLVEQPTTIIRPARAGILAYKRAIYSCSADVHAQAVAWYNLGWMEFRMSCHVRASSGKGNLQAAVRCFKRAIELEAGNAENWNALGVATTTLSSKVAQHSFVRSLHLNELNAKVWTNLGVLYLLQNDLELSRQAFGRAQSTDPEYAHAWLGQGLISLLGGDKEQALGHFTHAFEISSAASMIVKEMFALSSFDDLLATPASRDLGRLTQPMFALQQLLNQTSEQPVFDHLAALFSERGGDFTTAAASLQQLCIATEAEFEATESMTSLARAALAKCDLARSQLAAGSFADAIENVELALDLTSDADNSGLDAEARRKLRLSCHLTAGLAHHRLDHTQDSVAMFRAALQESDSDPDVVCALVQVLWARGGADEKSVARDQLFAAVEAHPQHISAVCLLAAIAALDDDAETSAAVADDLRALRVAGALNDGEPARIDSILAALDALARATGGETGDPVDDADSGTLAEVQSAILLDPSAPHGWTALSQLSGADRAAEMALRTTVQAVPPHGQVAAEGLAAAFADAGSVADAQRAIFVAPWLKIGWESLEAGVRN